MSSKPEFKRECEMRIMVPLLTSAMLHKQSSAVRDLARCLCVVLVVGVFGCRLSSSQESATPRPVVDQLAESVLFLRATDAEGTVRWGTGFNVRFQGTVFVVTAKHVVRDAVDVKVSANKTDGSVDSFGLSATSHITSQWLLHPSADLAAHPYDPERLPGIVGKVVVADGLPTTRPHLLDEVVAIGFPYAAGSNNRNQHLSPVAQKAIVVSWPGFHSGQAGRYFLVEPALYPGFSGGPIFSMDEPPGAALIRERSSVLIGVHVGNLTLGWEGDGRPDQTLAAVVPARELIELLSEVGSEGADAL